MLCSQSMIIERAEDASKVTDGDSSLPGNSYKNLRMEMNFHSLFSNPHVRMQSELLSMQKTVGRPPIVFSMESDCEKCGRSFGGSNFSIIPMSLLNEYAGGSCLTLLSCNCRLIHCCLVCYDELRNALNAIMDAIADRHGIPNETQHNRTLIEEYPAALQKKLRQDQRKTRNVILLRFCAPRPFGVWSLENEIRAAVLQKFPEIAEKGKLRVCYDPNFCFDEYQNSVNNWISTLDTLQYKVDDV